MHVLLVDVVEEDDDEEDEDEEGSRGGVNDVHLVWSNLHFHLLGK